MKKHPIWVCFCWLQADKHEHEAVNGPVDLSTVSGAWDWEGPPCYWHHLAVPLTGQAVWRARCGISNKLRCARCVFTNNFCQLPPLFTENYAVQPLKPKATNQSYERRQHCQVFHVRSTESFSIECVPAYGFGTFWCLLHFWYFKNTE